jgi:hypothetical protein
MKNSTRTSLFFFFCALFVITTPIVVLYSQGYRVDWENKAIAKTGALFIEANPTPVQLAIDGELTEESNFVFQNIYTDNLLPKDYKVELKKDGYFTWSKQLAIVPKFVTEVKNVILFPQSPIPRQIASNIENFYISPSSRLIAVSEKNTIPQVNIFSIDEQKEYMVFLENSTTSLNVITDIQWNNDSSRIAVSLENPSGTEWMAIDLTGMEQIDATVNSPLDLSTTITLRTDLKKYTRQFYKPVIRNLRWSEQNSNKIFFLVVDGSKQSLLFSYNLQTEKLSDPLAYDVPSFVIDGNKAFYISNILGTINSLDLSNDQITQHSFYPLKVKESVMTQENFPDTIIEISNPYLVAKIDNSIYLYNLARASFEKLDDHVDKALLTDDGTKLLTLKRNLLRVHWLTDTSVQPFRDRGDSLKIAQTKYQITDATWLSRNNEYVIYSDSNMLTITELDGRDHQNAYTYKFGEDEDRDIQKILYIKREHATYYLSKDSLYHISLK